MHFGQLKRRKFIALLAGSGTVWPGTSFGQALDGRKRIGLLDYSGPDVERARLWDIFRQRLNELGYTEGANIAFVQRWAYGSPAQLQTLAAELVDLKVDVITTAASPSAQAAMRATSTVPIVMATGNDPVDFGISSISRPGGNVTGIVTLSAELAPKRLEILRELIPQLTRVASLVDLSNSTSVQSERKTEATAKALGISLKTVGVHSPKELEDAFRSIREERVDALIVEVSGMFFGERNRIAELSGKEKMPTMGSQRAYADAGCLITYGASFADTFRQAAEYVDKVLRGTKPSELPIQQPTKFELVINLKVARALGLTVPSILLASADEVIE